MKKIVLLVMIVFLAPATSFAARQPKREVKKGNLLYNKGSFKEALKKYEEALKIAPDSDVVNFNLGNALYKTEDYQGSLSHLEKSLLTDDASLKQKASYNLGNAKYKYGIGQEESNLQAAVDLLTQSLRHYEKAMELDPEDEDAKHNHEFVAKELQRLKEKLQQQKQQEEQQKQEQEQQQQEQQSQEQGTSEEKKQKAPEGRSKEEQSGQEQSKQEQAREQPQEKQAGQKEKKSGSEKEGKAGAQPQKEQETPGQMSEKEALMLLDSYRHEDEPQGLLKPKMPQRNVPEVVKDW